MHIQLRLPDSLCDTVYSHYLAYRLYKLLGDDIQPHIDVYSSGNRGIYLRFVCIPRPRESVDDSINIRRAEL